MIETRKIKGVVPVVITPLNKDCTVDNQGLKSNYFFEEKKIGGFWTLGTGSEDMNLSFQKSEDCTDNFH